MDRLYYRLDEISEMYGVKVRTLRTWIYYGKLKASKIGRRYLVARAEMERVMKENEFKPFNVRSIF